MSVWNDDVFRFSEENMDKKGTPCDKIERKFPLEITSGQKSYHCAGLED